MDSQKKSTLLFFGKMIFLSSVLTVAFLLLIVLFFEVKDISYWLQDYGGLIGSVLAVIAAIAAISYQSMNTQKQIKAQRDLERSRLLRAKIEEAYSCIEGLRLKVLLTRRNAVKDVVQDIDVFNHDLANILMLHNLHKLIDGDLIKKYSDCITSFLGNWSVVAQNYLDGVDSSQEEHDRHMESFEVFNLRTKDALEYLSLMSRQENI